MVKNNRIIVFGSNKLATDTVEFLRGLGHSDVSLREDSVGLACGFDLGVICFDLKFFDTGRPATRAIVNLLSSVATKCENFYIRSNLMQGELGQMNQFKFQKNRLFYWPHFESGKIPLVSVSPRVPEKHIAIHKQYFGENVICAPLRSVEAAFYMHQSYVFVEKVLQITMQNIYRGHQVPFSEIMTLVASQNDALCARFGENVELNQVRAAAQVLMHSVSKRNLKESALFEVCEGLLSLYTGAGDKGNADSTG